MGSVNSIPIISQVKSAIQAISGDVDGARKTQEEFASKTPVVSQIDSFVQLVSGNPQEAERIQKEFLGGVGERLNSGIEVLTFGLYKPSDNKEVDIEEGPSKIRFEVGIHKLQADYLKNMDNDLKILTAEVYKKLDAQFTGKEVTWEEILTTLNSVTVIEKDNSRPEVHRTDKFQIQEIDAFKTRESPEKYYVTLVLIWMKMFINDEDIFEKVSFNKEEMANIVATTGAPITDPASLLYKEKIKERTVYDYAFLRFPDIDRPYLKIFKIKLKARAITQSEWLVERSHNEIEGTLDVIYYKPNPEEIKKLTDDHKNEAIKYAEDLLTSP